MVHGPGHPDAQSSVKHPAQGRDRVAAAFGRSERGLRVGQQRLAGAGEGDAALVAVEKGLAEFAFQASDLGADGRLGYRHPGRGAVTRRGS